MFKLFSLLRNLLILSILLTNGPATYPQRSRGELQLEVRDAKGGALAGTAELSSRANQFHETFRMGVDGRYTVKEILFGVYRLKLEASGFAPWEGLLEIRSEVPVRCSVTLGVARLETRVEVTDAATLVDPSSTGSEYTIGRQSIGEAMSAQPGRSLSDLVNELPGWLTEANGVLHPRGAEYQVQYVVDRMPVTQNVSAAFAPPIDPQQVQSIRVMTGSYPAEYGRKLGGVVELATKREPDGGFHGQLQAGGGSFAASQGSAGIFFASGKNAYSFAGNGFHTARYLDPPTLNNFTNWGTDAGFSGSFERDISPRDRLRVSLNRGVLRYLVPNDLVQQSARQRQDVEVEETSGQIYFHHVISSDLLFSFLGSIRDSGTVLTSNPLAKPIIVFEDRGYREGYAGGSVTGHRKNQEWKAGIDTIFSPVREKLNYQITDLAQFDPGTLQQFRFNKQHWDVESSAYAENQFHLGNWNLAAGLRFDHYRFAVTATAWSPRIGISRYLPKADLLLHTSYDRIFQTPAIENLLLASSPTLASLNPVVLRLPVEPSLGNYYEAGLTKSLLGRVRLDATIFRRDFENYADDDVLLDTGVSFPIAFRKARIMGEEFRMEVPHWGKFSGFVSYANQSGLGQGPITGGLLIGSEAAGALTDTSRFAVSQDQRNTLRYRVRLQATRRIWLATGGQYGSGLPAETNGVDQNQLLSQYGAAVLNGVNLDRGRVRPNFSLSAAAGMEFYRHEKKSAALQFEAQNLTNRTNLINFASLFSGTAVAPPRSVSARMALTF